MIDLKTIYEQLTTELKPVDKYSNNKYIVEVFQQPNTPIYAFVYWTHKATIHSISFTIKEN